MSEHLPENQSEPEPDIFALSHEAVDRLAADSPTLATRLGIPGHDGRWDDLSPAGLATTGELHARLRAEAQRCATPDRRHLLAMRVLVDYCDGHLENYEASSHHFDLNNISSPHQNLRFIFGSQAKTTRDDWEAIIARLQTIAAPLDGFRQTLEEGRRAGHTVSRRQVETVIEQGRVASGDRSSFDRLREELGAAPFDATALAASLDTGIERAKDAYRSFKVYLASVYLADAVDADAVGEERYRLAARTFLGTELDLGATYRWGWDEVERLWSDLQVACAAVDPDVPVAAVIEDLQTNPDHAVETPEEFVELMRARQEQALSDLDGVHFDVPEGIRTVDVQIEPPGGASAAHYVQPSEDLSRPGSVWYPIAGRRHIPLFREITTAYHEGFPGHHLQIGMQATLADELSRLHRLVAWYPGSGEGWALYAERLMGELGYLERPEYVVGLLASQLMRACRVVIDIGTHLRLPIPDDVSFYPGRSWSFELARELLTGRALEPPASATSEVIRYFGWPGQAIAYKVGEQAILDLRTEWERRSGFDPRAFHSELLAIGSVGLDLIRDHLLP